jgi:hypothetical protein
VVPELDMYDLRERLAAVALAVHLRRDWLALRPQRERVARIDAIARR